MFRDSHKNNFNRRKRVLIPTLVQILLRVRFTRNSVFTSRYLTLNLRPEFFQHMVEIKTGGVLSTECLKPCKNNTARGRNRGEKILKELHWKLKGKGRTCIISPM